MVSHGRGNWTGKGERGRTDGSTHHERVIDLLAEEPLFRERVAGVVRDGIDGSLLHLVLDGFEQDKDGLSGSVFEVVVHGEGHPIREHLFHHRFGPAQHQLRMFGAHGLLHQPEEERAQNAGGVFHVAHQRHDQKRSHVNPATKSIKTGQS